MSLIRLNNFNACTKHREEIEFNHKLDLNTTDQLHSVIYRAQVIQSFVINMKYNFNPSIKKSPLNFKLIKQIKYDLKIDSVQSWARRLRCQYWKSQMISGSSCTRFESQLTLIRANTPLVINMSNIVVLCLLAVGTQTYNLQRATTIWNQGQENQQHRERKNHLSSTILTTMWSIVWSITPTTYRMNGLSSTFVVLRQSNWIVITTHGNSVT